MELIILKLPNIVVSILKMPFAKHMHDIFLHVPSLLQTYIKMNKLKSDIQLEAHTVYVTLVFRRVDHSDHIDFSYPGAFYFVRQLELHF